MSNIELVKAVISNNDGTIKIVIPKKIREKLNIKAGDSLLVTFDKQNRLIYKKVGM